MNTVTCFRGFPLDFGRPSCIDLHINEEKLILLKLLQQLILKDKELILMPAMWYVQTSKLCINMH